MYVLAAWYLCCACTGCLACWVGVHLACGTPVPTSRCYNTDHVQAPA